MINLLVKNGDNGRLLLRYSKGNNAAVDLLTIDDLGLPKIATADARRSYSIIDSLRKIMRDEDILNSSINITLDGSYTHSTNSNNLTTIFRYLNRDIDDVAILGDKVVFGQVRSA